VAFVFPLFTIEAMQALAGQSGGLLAFRRITKTIFLFG